MKKTISTLLAFVLAFALVAPGMSAQAENTKTITELTVSSYSASSVGFSGKAENGVLAIAAAIYSGDTLVAMVTVGTSGVDNSTFSGTISGLSLSYGTYTLRAADYDGGAWKTASFTLSAPSYDYDPPASNTNTNTTADDTTTQNPDGSSTETKTNRDGSVTETTTAADGSKTETTSKTDTKTNSDGSTTATTTETKTSTAADGATTQAKSETATTTKTNADGSATETATTNATETTKAADGTVTEIKTEAKAETTSTSTANADGTTTTAAEIKATETKTQTVTNADGTKTEIKTVTETTAERTATVDAKGNGTVSESKTETVTDAAGNKLSETKTETATVIVTDTAGTQTSTATATAVTTDAEGNTTTTVTVTEDAVMADGTTATTVSDGEGNTLSFEAKVSESAAETAADSGKPVQLPGSYKPVDPDNAEAAPSVALTLPKIDGTVKVEIETPTTSSGNVAYLRSPDGTQTLIKRCTTGSVIVPVTGSCELVIVDNTKTFRDVAANSWAKNAITFTTAREIFNGTGNDLFGPALSMTRGMLMTILARYDGADAYGADWQEKGMAWSRSNGVSDAAAPETDVTREQIVTMLWRYADKPKAAKALSGYPDADRISGYAAEAVAWAVENGIMKGYDGLLDPQGTATRDQVAQFFMNFASL